MPCNSINVAKTANFTSHFALRVLWGIGIAWNFHELSFSLFVNIVAIDSQRMCEKQIRATQTYRTYKSEPTELQMDCSCKVFEIFLHVVWAWGAHEKVFHERLGFTKRSRTL
jgi:hypothetical protein